MCLDKIPIQNNQNECQQQLIFENRFDCVQNFIAILTNSAWPLFQYQGGYEIKQTIDNGNNFLFICQQYSELRIQYISRLHVPNKQQRGNMFSSSVPNNSKTILINLSKLIYYVSMLQNQLHSKLLLHHACAYYMNYPYVCLLL